MDDKLVEDKITKEKLTEKNWFILLICIVFFPVGVYLLWLNGKFSTATKVVITVFQTIFFSLFLAILIAPFVIDFNAIDSDYTTTSPIENIPIKYRVVEINESPYLYTKRYSWRVVVDEELNSTELEQVARDVIEESKTKTPFSALTVFLYDNEAYINYNATLGQATFAPNGDWGQADTVGVGQYDRMDYSYEIYEKDWSKKLTDFEVEVYGAYSKAMDSYYDSNQEPDKDLVEINTAEQFGISQEEVKDILGKQTKWSVNDIK